MAEPGFKLKSSNFIWSFFYYGISQKHLLGNQENYKDSTGDTSFYYTVIDKYNEEKKRNSCRNLVWKVGMRDSQGRDSKTAAQQYGWTSAQVSAMKIPPSLLGINLVWVGECYHLNLYGLRRHSVFLLICVAKGQSSPSLYSPTPVRAWKRKFYMGFPRSEWTGESPFGAATSPESPAAEHFDLWETGAKHYQPSSFSFLSSVFPFTAFMWSSFMRLRSICPLSDWIYFWQYYFISTEKEKSPFSGIKGEGKKSGGKMKV